MDSAASAGTKGRIAYDADYFERGEELGISGYTNYRWLPELTIRMAHSLIVNLPIKADETVLDFGCSKGYLVKALRFLDCEAYGVDISSYAIDNCDPEVSQYCELVTGSNFGTERGGYDWLIAKDVLEHMSETMLRALLTMAHSVTDHIFAVVPLAEDNLSGRYIVPSYNDDATHVLAKRMGWWEGVFRECGWRPIKRPSFTFPRVKENWAKEFPKGNGFLIMGS